MTGSVLSFFRPKRGGGGGGLFEGGLNRRFAVLQGEI